MARQTPPKHKGQLSPVSTNGDHDVILSGRPSPADFVNYLPWAVKQLGSECMTIVVKRISQERYIPVSEVKKYIKNKPKSTRTSIYSEHTPKSHMTELSPTEVIIKAKTKANLLFSPSANLTENFIRVAAIYDDDNLLQIKFEQNSKVPYIIFSIIYLIVKFYPYLFSIAINSGLNRASLHEICKIIPISNITDLCFDGTYLNDANYHNILDNPHKLRYLSLSRCKIDDVMLETIAPKLKYSMPASKSLALLNLSMNRITDAGALFLGEALRDNRKLSYLNLAGNMLTDNGVDVILNALLEFPLTYDESIDAKARYIDYLKKRNEAITNTLKNFKHEDKKPLVPTKKKNAPAVGKRRKSEDNETVLLKKALTAIITNFGEFEDPYNVANTIPSEGLLWCKGNNTLSYLNIAYNSCITAMTLKKLNKVMEYQKAMQRKPQGLITLSVEGNFISETCLELAGLDVFIDSNIQQASKLVGEHTHPKTSSSIKKKG